MCGAGAERELARERSECGVCRVDPIPAIPKLTFKRVLAAVALPTRLPLVEHVPYLNECIHKYLTRFAKLPSMSCGPR